MICYLFNIQLFYKKYSLFNSFLSFFNSDNYIYLCIVYLISDDDVICVGFKFNILMFESELIYFDVVFFLYELYGMILQYK